MELHEIHCELRSILDRIEKIEAVADEPDEPDEPPVSVDDGFVILPIARFEALREAEEHLQETRFAPTNGEPPGGRIEGLEGIYNRIGETMERLDETLDRGKSRTAGADCYRSLAALRADIRDGLKGSEYAAYRDAEDGPTNGEPDEKQATIDVLTRRVNELVETKERLVRVLDVRGRYIREQAEEIGRLREEAKAEAPAGGDDRHNRTVDALMRHLSEAHDEIHRLREAGAPLEGVSDRQVADEVFLKHIQVLQAEIDGIKDRLDEGCGEFNKIKARLEQIGAVGMDLQMLKGLVDNMTPSFDAKLGAHWDRINALVARMNKLEARDGLTPILRDEAREHVEAIKSRLLQEVNPARKTDPS